MAIDIHQRLKESEESRRRAWRVLEEIRLVLEVAADAQIPRENVKRFRSEGDRLIKSLIITLFTLRSAIDRLETTVQTARSIFSRLGMRDELRLLSEGRVKGGHGLDAQQITEREARLRDLGIGPVDSDLTRMG